MIMKYTVYVNGIGDNKKAKDKVTQAYSYISRQCSNFYFLPNENRGGLRFSITSTALNKEEIKSAMEQYLPNAIIGVE